MSVLKMHITYTPYPGWVDGNVGFFKKACPLWYESCQARAVSLNEPAYYAYPQGSINVGRRKGQRLTRTD